MRCGLVPYGSSDLASRHRILVAQYERFDMFRSVPA